MVLCTYVCPYIDTHIPLYCTVFWVRKLHLLLTDQPKRMETRWNKRLSATWKCSKTVTLLLFTCHNITTVILMRFLLTLKIWENALFTRNLPYFWQIQSLVHFCCFCETIQIKNLSFTVFTPITRKTLFHPGISRALCTVLLAIKKQGRWKK